MIPPAGPSSNILAASISLYTSAILWALVVGPGNFLTGLLSGAASISLGVWIGLTLTAPTPPPDPLELEEDW